MGNNQYNKSKLGFLKWFFGVLGGIISGVVVYHLTVGYNPTNVIKEPSAKIDFSKSNNEPQKSLSSDPADLAQRRIRCRQSCDAKFSQDVSRCPDDPQLANLREIDPYGSIYSIENQVMYGSKDRQCVFGMEQRKIKCYEEACGLTCTRIIDELFCN